MEKQKIEAGLGSAGTRLKSLHKKSADYDTTSFKTFVREQAKLGNPDVKEWMRNRSGANDKKRSEAKLAKIAAERTATKQSRKAVKKS